MSSLVITEVVKASEGLEINHVVTVRLGAHSPSLVITKNHTVSRVKLLLAQVTNTTDTYYERYRPVLVVTTRSVKCRLCVRALRKRVLRTVGTLTRN